MGLMRTVLLLTAGLSAGCLATTSGVPYLGDSLQPLPASTVVNAYPQRTPPDGRPFIVVGEVFVKRASGAVWGKVDRPKLLNDLRAEARKLGADGILLLRGDSSGVTSRSVDQQWYWGVAVRYLPEWRDREQTEREMDRLDKAGAAGRLAAD